MHYALISSVFRTRDRTFESVSHLIDHPRHNNLPIISAESALRLDTPVRKIRRWPVTINMCLNTLHTPRCSLKDIKVAFIVEQKFKPQIWIVLFWESSSSQSCGAASRKRPSLCTWVRLFSEDCPECVATYLAIAPILIGCNYWVHTASSLCISVSSLQSVSRGWWPCPQYPSSYHSLCTILHS